MHPRPGPVRLSCIANPICHQFALRCPPTIAAMDDNLNKANSIHHVDEASAKSVHDVVTTPESLRHMSDDEIKSLDTKMVRKLDCVIL